MCVLVTVVLIKLLIQRGIDEVLNDVSYTRSVYREDTHTQQAATLASETKPH